MPRLWSETIDAHRREVHDAIIDTAASLVAEGGLRSVTMSQIAEKTGIARATLYKYFPDVESILLAWHERQVSAHLAQLAVLRDRPGMPGERLEAVLSGYALLSHDSRAHHDTDVAAFLHRDQEVARARRQLLDMIRSLIAEGAKCGELRDDIPSEELASFCVHALAAARSLPSKAAVRRLVKLTLAALRPRTVDSSA